MRVQSSNRSRSGSASKRAVRRVKNSSSAVDASPPAIPPAKRWSRRLDSVNPRTNAAYAVRVRRASPSCSHFVKYGFGTGSVWHSISVNWLWSGESAGVNGARASSTVRGRPKQVAGHRVGIEATVVRHVGGDLEHRLQQCAGGDVRLAAVGVGLGADHLDEQPAAGGDRRPGGEEGRPVGGGRVGERGARVAGRLAEVEAVRHDDGGLLPQPVRGRERHADVHRAGGRRRFEERHRGCGRHDRGSAESQIAVGRGFDVVEQQVPVVGREVVVDGNDGPRRFASRGPHRSRCASRSSSSHPSTIRSRRRRTSRPAGSETASTHCAMSAAPVLATARLVLRVLVVVVGHALRRGHREGALTPRR